MIKTTVVSVACALAFSFPAFAQDNTQAAPPMIFKTDYTPKPSDPRQPLQFTLPGGPGTAPQAQPEKYDAVPEAEPYKAYLGYPKHKLGAVVAPINIAATWNYNGQDFNFRNNTVAYGINYEFVATPQWSFGFEYQHYSMTVEAASASAFRIEESTESYDDYKATGNYCFISHSSFFRRFCAGFNVGNDSYPVLKFTDSVHLEMGKVQDIVIGVNVGYQMPFGDTLVSKVTLGYDRGLGMGNSGELTPKENSTIYLKGDMLYEFRRQQQILFGLDARSRSATLEGKIGNNDDTWETTSLLLGARVGYVYTF